MFFIITFFINPTIFDDKIAFTKEPLVSAK